MKASLFFLLYFISAALLAAFIAIPLYQTLHTGSFEFESWVTRSALLLLVVGIFPTMKWFQLSNHLIGHNLPIKTFLLKSSKAFLVGLIILGVVIFLLVILDLRLISINEPIGIKLLLKALIAGLVVALIEETLFRGLFFSLSKKWHGVITAVIISSFFYALLHFIKPIDHIDSTSIQWFSGLSVILNAFTAVLSLDITDFLALFSVGVLLAIVRQQTNTLAYCIGLHASWVFLIKISKELSSNNSNADWGFLTGKYDGVIGLLSFGWISIVILIYVIYIIKSRHSAVH
ncbi:MAG: CPBP family intramembrane metalloprotease [Piscirickettsiaceae bacterium]|nr:MAG: CPBP family intramembrane metalloprotease [Piscirickettsiaceae bacterium]